MQHLTRRSILSLIAAGPATGKLWASGDFWNKKDPRDWSSEEIDRLSTNSPWAKAVTVQLESGDRGAASNPGSPGPVGGGRPRIGLGIPGIGGTYPGGGGTGWPGSGGGGRRNPGSGRGGPYNAHGTVLWESAQPLLDALKPEFPENFKEHYVLTLTGIAWPQAGDEESEQRALEDLKSVTYLRIDGGGSLQPGRVEKPLTSSGSSILFGFSKELLHVAPDDKEVVFTTRLGRSPVQVKFAPKEMMYRGKLAM